MEITYEELRQIQTDRESLVSEIATLKASPETGSFKELADRVCKNMLGLTPDQKRRLNELITNRGFQKVEGNQ